MAIDSMKTDAFFSGVDPILRTLVVGALAYVGLVILLRASGKRTLSKFNAFDFIVTVALGSTLATILLSDEVSLAQGLAALGLLVGLQFAITWTSVRIPFVRKLVTGEPRLLLYQGTGLPEAMRASRVTHDELQAAARLAGLASPADAFAIVLETDGSITTVPNDSTNSGRSLAGMTTPADSDGRR